MWGSSGFRFIIIYVLLVITSAQVDIEQLPDCLKDRSGLLLVSTLDGKFSALTDEGTLKWQIDTDPGPLLVSNIHHMELSNHGKWIRMIPSLTGSLYLFNGELIEPVGVTAESLLRSSYYYSEELVIAGGLEVRTYGIGLRSGTIVYTCSTHNCVNRTNSGEAEDLVILERTTQTVRAVESHTGYEKWNFSVGQHNIKSTHISCSDPNVNLFNWNVTAIIPEGFLSASKYEDNVKRTWSHKFTSPIVKVWKWNGHNLSEVNLFQIHGEEHPTKTEYLPAIYLGMHKRQLYIYESHSFHDFYAVTTGHKRNVKIPFKPVFANNKMEDEKSTALSVLYKSSYIDEKGFFLYSDTFAKQKQILNNNETLKYPALTYVSKADYISWFMAMWWKELIVFILTTSVFFNYLLRALHRRQQKQVIFVDRPVEIPMPKDPSSERLSESSDTSFNSRYLNDFDTLRCLGKGGFGVVFEVKQKIDECNYAIKRIVLPNEKGKRETVMREVKALAKLEHHNIVRYFNSWVEQPPMGWQQQHDSEWIKDCSEFPSESTTNHNATPSSVEGNSLSGIKIENSLCRRDKSSDSFIVFAEESAKSEEESKNTDVVSYKDSEGVNWSRADRKVLNFETDPPAFLYIQMQLCQKQSLREWLVTNRERHFPDIFNIFKQIVSAVEYVHLQGLIHRDLKPSNIFFSLDGQIKVGDFGLVKDEEEAYDSFHGYSSLRGHTRHVGTRLYMSPEQLSGQKYNYKVDIYSLGLIFFELLVYFSTDMERINTMTDLRDNKFPKDFIENYKDEYYLLLLMLCQLPEKRLTTFGVRARPPFNSCDNDYNEVYDFELPKVRPGGWVNSKT